MTDIPIEESYGCKFKRCNKENKAGNEEIQLTKDMKSEEKSDSNAENQIIVCSSKYEPTNSEVRDKRSVKQDANTESNNSQNNVTGYVYQCKYCTEESKVKDHLITPCRCSGSLGYVHKHCLEIWIKARSKGRAERELRCELCGYRFHRQKHYKWSRLSCSELDRSDRWLYTAGIISMFIVIGSVSVLVYCFTQDTPFAKRYLESTKDQLSASSVNTNEIHRAMETFRLSTLDKIKIACAIVCSLVFLLCVFLTKLCKVPPLKLILRHIQPNQQWTALPYSASRDSLVTGNVANV